MSDKTIEALKDALAFIESEMRYAQPAYDMGEEPADRFTYDAVPVCLQLKDAIESLSAPASPAGFVMVPREEWRCFHCDEVFTDKAEAFLHFGNNENHEPACRLNQVEGGLLALFRQANEKLWEYRDDCDAQSKQFYALGSAHHSALIREEQKGYDRGLADGRAMLSASPQPEMTTGRALDPATIEAAKVKAP